MKTKVINIDYSIFQPDLNDWLVNLSVMNQSDDPRLVNGKRAILDLTTPKLLEADIVTVH